MYPFINTHIEFFRYALPIAAALLLLALLLFQDRKSQVLQGTFAVTMLLLFLLSALFYTQRNYNNGKYFNTYEYYHYYLPAKYDEELGYMHLYDMTYLALEEEKYPQLPTRIRDLKTMRNVNPKPLLYQKEALKSRFSEDRWEEWKADNLFFRGLMHTDTGWNNLMKDKGFNATPVWLMIAGPLTTLFPIEGTFNIFWLPWLDVLFAILAFACLWRAFGIRTTAFLFILLMTHYVTSQWPLKAAFMRLDWIMALLCAASMLKLKHYRSAGFFVAYATCMRIFPILFAFGLAAKLILELIIKRKLNRDLLQFFISATLSGLALVFLSILYTGGLDSWTEFIEKVSEHSKSINLWRMGFLYVFLTAYNDSGGLWEMPYTTILEQYTWLLRSIQAITLILIAGLSYRLKAHEALCFSFIPVFILTGSTYYYYIMLLIPFLFFATHTDKRLHAFGMMFMFITAAIGHHYYLEWDRTWPLFFTLSCCVTITCLHMMLLAAIRLYKGQQEAPETT